MGDGSCTRSSERSVPPPSPHGWLGLIAAPAALVVVVLGARYAGHGEPGRVDAWIQPAVEGVGPPVRAVALGLDFLGEPGGAAALVGALVTACLLLRRPRAAALVVAGAGTAVGTATLLKHLVGRTIHGDGNLSFPSGHTAFLTALAVAVALPATGRLGLGRTAGTSLVLAAALVAGAAMGWAQVALGAHYPTDVLGGWCTALAVTPATAWLVDRTADRMTGRRDEPAVDGGQGDSAAGAGPGEPAVEAGRDEPAVDGGHGEPG